jgi:hypothetical protein
VRDEHLELARESGFLGKAKVKVDDPGFLALLDTAESRIPFDVPPLRTITEVRLRRKGTMRGLVGLTWYGESHGPGTSTVRQTITFYSELLYQLTDGARLAVVAHELAHAWLNEYSHPERSRERENGADELARKWGFGEELDELDSQAETI